jgi:tetratricopeptide (TPR) repeat protein
MVITMQFFKFKLRESLICLLALPIAGSIVTGALAADSEVVLPKPSMDKSGTAKMFLRGGELEAERSNWEAAVEKFNEALKLDQDNAIAHYDLGVAQFHLGQLELASQAEKRAIVLDPKLIDAYIQLASILSKLADYSGAEEILERALKVDEHCQIARDSLNEICRLKKSNPGMFHEREADTVPQAKLKHSS